MGYSIVTLVLVQLASSVLSGWIPILAGVKIGWALVYFFYAAAAIAVLQASTKIGMSTTPYTKDQIKWAFIIAVFAMVIGILLPRVMPQLFPLSVINAIDFNLPPFAVVPI